MKENIFINSKEGCIRRKLDAKRLIEYFKINGHKIVVNPKEADVMILITCGATNHRAKLAYNDIECLKKFKGKLIVAGCVPEIEIEKIKKHWKGDIFSTRDLEDSPEKIDEFFPENTIKFKDITDQNLPWITIDTNLPKDAIKDLVMQCDSTKRIYARFFDHMYTNIFSPNYMHFGDLIKIPVKDFYLIRVSRGCSKKCTYCAIGRAIGKHRSKPIELCSKELKKGVEEGYKNIFLTADDMGAYGIDIGLTFPKLLDGLMNVPGVYNIGIKALNPVWMVKFADELVELVKKEKIKSILVPIQSGSNNILKLMHRYSNRDKVIESFNRLKEAYPPLEISTQIIVGFPTETEEDFEKTLDLIIKADIDFGGFYPMSLRPDTSAVDINPKIQDDVIEKRVRYAQKYLKKNGYKAIYYDGGLVFGGKR